MAGSNGNKANLSPAEAEAGLSLATKNEVCAAKPDAGVAGSKMFSDPTFCWSQNFFAKLSLAPASAGLRLALFPFDPATHPPTGIVVSSQQKQLKQLKLTV